uniref:Uncharacterized protein n=1 Tax=Quercus lobata TaxID=97700 RepID=A0A7N2LR50_QUELO
MKECLIILSVIVVFIVFEYFIERVRDRVLDVAIPVALMGVFVTALRFLFLTTFPRCIWLRWVIVVVLCAAFYFSFDNRALIHPRLLELSFPHNIYEIPGRSLKERQLQSYISPYFPCQFTPPQSMSRRFTAATHNSHLSSCPIPLRLSWYFVGRVFLLKKREVFSLLSFCPESPSYSSKTLISLSHSSTDALQKTMLSSAKSKWDTRRAPLHTATPLICPSLSSFLSIAKNPSVQSWKRSRRADVCRYDLKWKERYFKSEESYQKQWRQKIDLEKNLSILESEKDVLQKKCIEDKNTLTINSENQKKLASEQLEVAKEKIQELERRCRGTGIQGSQIQCILPNRFYSFTMRHPLMVVGTADRNLIVFNLQNPLVTFSSNKMNQ